MNHTFQCCTSKLISNGGPWPRLVCSPCAFVTRPVSAVCPYRPDFVFVRAPLVFPVFLRRFSVRPLRTAVGPLIRPAPGIRLAAEATWKQ